MNLEMFMRMGGKLDKIDLSKTFSEYFDKNQYEKIISFEDKGDMNGKTKLLYFTFSNGNTKRYALMWIYTQVEMVLHERFL